MPWSIIVASKRSPYRRWSRRVELVADAVQQTLPRLSEPLDTGSVREDLLACLRAVATLLNGLSGEAVRTYCREAPREARSALRRSRGHAPDPPITHPNRVRHVTYLVRVRGVVYI
jgi:hypothetical protein